MSQRVSDESAGLCKFSAPESWGEVLHRTFWVKHK